MWNLEGRSCLRIDLFVCVGVTALRGFISKVDEGCRMRGEHHPARAKPSTLLVYSPKFRQTLGFGS